MDFDIKYIKEEVEEITEKNHFPKNITSWVTFFAYAIPAVFFMYVLYINILPFGYSNTYVIDVGSQNDIDATLEFYIKPTKNLGDAKPWYFSNAYRQLNGTTEVVFKPKNLLDGLNATITVDGDNVTLISPIINLDPSLITWDHSFDFSSGIPPQLEGNAFMFDNEIFFNGENTHVQLANSTGEFENKKFSLYTEWKPADPTRNGQQIVGHYNWELWQNSDSVEFRVGRMNDKKGRIYSITHPIDNSSFFDTEHTALAVYNPSDKGYIELYIDGTLVGRTDIGTDRIWEQYGFQNLSFGWTPHNPTVFYMGSIDNVRYVEENVIGSVNNSKFVIPENFDGLNFFIQGGDDAVLRKIKLHVSK